MLPFEPDGPRSANPASGRDVYMLNLPSLHVIRAWAEQEEKLSLFVAIPTIGTFETCGFGLDQARYGRPKSKNPIEPIGL